jgi:hypothetical protein
LLSCGWSPHGLPRAQHDRQQRGAEEADGEVDDDGGRRWLPRPIREQHEQRALDAAIATKRVEIVQRVLGHRDIRSTLGYAELQDARVRAALEGRAPQ